MKKHKFLILIISLMVYSSVDAQALWTNSEEGFAARFPTNPIKMEAAASAGSGYAYQSVKEFDNGGALFTITVMKSIPRNLQIPQLRDYIEESHIEFIRSMGVNPARAETNWTIFGDGRSN